MSPERCSSQPTAAAPAGLIFHCLYAMSSIVHAGRASSY